MHAYSIGCIHTRIQKILSEGIQLWRRFFFFLYNEGWEKYHHKRAINGPPAKRHLNGVSLACWWWPNIERWLGSLVIFQGIWTRIAKKPYIFVIFQGGGGVRTPVPPSGSVHGICMFLYRLAKMSQELGTIQPAEDHGGSINFDKFPLGTRLYLYPWHVSKIKQSHVISNNVAFWQV